MSEDVLKNKLQIADQFSSASSSLRKKKTKKKDKKDDVELYDDGYIVKEHWEYTDRWKNEGRTTKRSTYKSLTICSIDRLSSTTKDLDEIISTDWHQQGRLTMNLSWHASISVYLTNRVVTALRNRAKWQTRENSLTNFIEELINTQEGEESQCWKDTMRLSSERSRWQCFRRILTFSFKNWTQSFASVTNTKLREKFLKWQIFPDCNLYRERPRRWCRNSIIWNWTNPLCAICHFPVCISDEECVFGRKNTYSESDRKTTKDDDKDVMSCVFHDVREPESWPISRKVPYFLTLKRNMQFSKETFWTTWTCAKEMFHSKMKFNLLMPISVILTLPKLKIDVRKDPCNRTVRPQMFGNWRNTSIGTNKYWNPWCTRFSEVWRLQASYWVSQRKIFCDAFLDDYAHALRSELSRMVHCSSIRKERGIEITDVVIT